MADKDKPDEPMPDFSDVQSGASSTAPVVETFETYEVKPGDSLSKIAKRHYGKQHEWKRIFEANKDTIKDPDKIFPGQKLKIPKSEAAPKTAPAPTAAPATGTASATTPDLGPKAAPPSGTRRRP